MYSNSLRQKHLCSLQIQHGPIQSRQLHFTNAQTLDDDEVQLKKKCENLLYPFLSLSLKNHFMYTKLNMIFYKFIMAEPNSHPPKW